MSHWAIDYIGLPWVKGEHDCWAFFRNVQAAHFGRDVPVINVDADDIRACVKNFVGHDERSNWEETSAPQDGDAVLMSQHQLPTHVGIWIDAEGGGILHCIKEAGVVFSKSNHLAQLGYNVLATYKYRGA